MIENIKCAHKIGIYGDGERGQVRYTCEKCGEAWRGSIEKLKAMNYLERTMGMKEGVNYWRKLRHRADLMKINRKKEIKYSGFWFPE